MRTRYEQALLKQNGARVLRKYDAAFYKAWPYNVWANSETEFRKLEPKQPEADAEPEGTNSFVLLQNDDGEDQADGPTDEQDDEEEEDDEMNNTPNDADEYEPDDEPEDDGYAAAEDAFNALATKIHKAAGCSRTEAMTKARLELDPSDFEALRTGPADASFAKARRFRPSKAHSAFNDLVAAYHEPGKVSRTQAAQMARRNHPDVFNAMQQQPDEQELK